MVGAPGMIIVIGWDKKKLMSNCVIFSFDSLTGEVVWTSADNGKVIATNERVYS
jgi:hypothetical protein